MGKSQAGMLQLWIYSGYNCGAITLHNVLTTPFGVLNPEKAIIVIGLNVTHSWNVCVSSRLERALGIFSLADRQITVDVY